MNKYLSLVKFSHTVFALPFALMGFFLATSRPDYIFEWRPFLLVLVCMITARNAAMAFNRYIDRNIDSKNPRTSQREIPSGVVGANAAFAFVIVNVLIFIITTYFINSLCFYLSPIALAVVLGYSYSKRFTFLCHLILGIGLSIAPVGAYIAVTAEFHLIPILYGVSVLFWVAGFDIIYALQDEEFDKSLDLYSIPNLLGKKNALYVSILFHLITAGILVFAGFQVMEVYPDLGFIHWIGLGIFLALLFYQHTIVSESDLTKVNMAFFTTNGIASLVFGTAVIIDLLM